MDTGTRIAQKFYLHLEKMLDRAMDPNDEFDLKAADLECIRKALLDNSLTLSSVERGDFGKVVQQAAAEFPFEGDDDTEGRDYANLN